VRHHGNKPGNENCLSTIIPDSRLYHKIRPFGAHVTFRQQEAAAAFGRAISAWQIPLRCAKKLSAS